MLQLERPRQVVVKIACCDADVNVHVFFILAWVDANVHVITTWRDVKGGTAEGATVIPSRQLVSHASDTPVIGEDMASCTVHKL